MNLYQAIIVKLSTYNLFIMKKSGIFAAGLAMLSVAAISCKHDPIFDPTQHTVTDNCDADTVYFANDILPLIVSNCAKSGCHDGSYGEEEKEDLSDYMAIINSGYVDPYNANHSKMIEVLTETGEDRMPPPPAAALTAAQRSLLETWINQGAKNNECSGGCDTLNVSYSTTIALTMTKYCNGCHSGGSPQGGIDLTTYANVAVYAANGSLLGSVQHIDPYTPMPYGGSFLPDCKIDEIRIWIENGYPND